MNVEQQNILAKILETVIGIVETIPEDEIERRLAVLRQTSGPTRFGADAEQQQSLGDEETRAAQTSR